MPKNVCFCDCDCECAGTDISRKDEKQTKTGKNEHESGLSAKSQRKSKLAIHMSSESQKWSLKFGRFTRLTLKCNLKN